MTFAIPSPSSAIPFCVQTRTADDARGVMVDSECVHAPAASAASGMDPYISDYVRDHTPAGKQWSIKCVFCCANDIYCGPGDCGPCDIL